MQGGGGCSVGRGGVGLRVGVAGEIDGENVLAGVVDGEILMGLEEAELAHLLRADAAGGEVGDAARSELDADVGNIDLGSEDGEADGVEVAHGRGGEGADDVEVMDHEVEDDIDIEGTGGEDAEAVRLKKHGAVEQRANGLDGGIETFEMADLQDALVMGREMDEVVGFFEGGSEGLFDEDIDTGSE